MPLINPKSNYLLPAREIVLHHLQSALKGEVFTDELHRRIYATDASVYRKLPLGVAFPMDTTDLKLLIEFAGKHTIGLIPRAAGTSLAGQCVGDGLVVDISRHMTRILSFEADKRQITVQPGVIRDELNDFLRPYGLFFGPDTSTTNRCMIGGMVGNNSSGTTSIKYGVTRDKVVAMKTLLSDGSEVVFSSVTADEFEQKMSGNTLEAAIYKCLYDALTDPQTQEAIHANFPDPDIHRRNNGYAVDELLKFSLFGGEETTVNVAKLLAGSEGTLALSTEITLRLDPLPPPENVMVAAHFSSIKETMEAVVVAMEHDLYTCELMDKTILDCTRNNREQLKNRFFVEGDPKAILMLELRTEDIAESKQKAEALIANLKARGLGYAYPMLINDDVSKALDLRKAGLGLLGNIVGDDKAVACIEDTAVRVTDLPEYIGEFSQMMEDFGQEAVYYAHAGAGELHLRPILNLKKKEDVKLFREITAKTARLVKKYGGSFSGEHGDGIVRAEFIPMMIGNSNYELLRHIKHVFDPQCLFNPGKIVDAFPMDENLRYTVDRVEPPIETLQDFSDSQGILRATEKCNGSGDCRKLPAAGGTMCPSYRATRNEKDSTRARANALREYLTNSEKDNRFDHSELYEVFDLCLSCKACASECPSNVDIAALKAEFLHQYYKVNKVPLRTRLFAQNAKWNRLGSIFPSLTNRILNTSLIKRMMGIATERSIPELGSQTVRKWYARRKKIEPQNLKRDSVIYLFLDEYTNFYDTETGKDTIELLEALGYDVKITRHEESGRSYISKGLLDKAKAIIDFNIEHFKDLIGKNSPLVGIEPSAILTFRDEHLRLAKDTSAARKISAYTYTIEEFIAREFESGRITSSSFTTDQAAFKIHGHCQQKSLSSMKPTAMMLGIPQNYSASVFSSGCCGMAGSFGYEKEHYALSMKVGEDTLFPKIRNTENSITIVAPGTSCRHQIKDGTGATALHPVRVLKQALI
jgi:FAD/FMN-containing dehydrogenase/Fe-S oxidoreductase